MYDVAVLPDAQGLGIGHRLMQRAHRLATEAGAERILLEAQDEPKLLKWYERQGYQRVRKRVDFYARGKHAWRLVKRPPFTGAGSATDAVRAGSADTGRDGRARRV